MCDVPAVDPAGWARQSVPLTVYAVQLLLNFMWTPLFFKLHKLDWASADILGEHQTWQGNRGSMVQAVLVLQH